MGILTRTRDRRAGKQQVSHAFYTDVLRTLPAATVWAVACDAEFRADGAGDLRGVLHHDGAILRFTTWGRVERFVGCPMEFEWALAGPGLLRLVDRDQRSWFMNLAPLADLVADPPAYAAPGGTDLIADLLDWMRTWS